MKPLALSLVVMLISGCSLQLPSAPRTFPTATVEGTIRLAGQTVPRGWVTFLPIAGTVGDLVIAPLDEEGRFRTDRAPVGPLAVRIALPKSEIDRLASVRPDIVERLRLFAGAGSPLRIASQSGAATTWDFDLIASPLPPDPVPN